MNMLLPREREFLENFPPPKVQPKAVGRRIGIGGQHAVYEYDNGNEPQVIKITRRDTRRDLISAWVSPIITWGPDKVQADYDLCSRYFPPDSVVKTDILADFSNTRYCILQPRLQIETLTPKLQHAHPELRDELRELLECNRRMLRTECVWCDFMGLDAARLVQDLPYMSNVGVQRTVEHTAIKRRLRMFDFALLHAPAFSWRGILGFFAGLIQGRNARQFGLRM